MIVWGTGLYGKVDRVPGLFHVATKFFHIWYVPLIPTQSWIVIAGTEKGNRWRGVELGLSGKSVLAAYFRLALVITVLVAGFRVISTLDKDRTGALMSGLAGVVAIVLLVVSLRARASRERAHRLGKILKLDLAVVDRALGFEETAESAPA
jgi:hypothetical protein